MNLLWFLAGGLSAIFLTRWLSRLLFRWFWIFAAAVFAAWALFIADPGRWLASASKIEQAPTLAASRSIFGHLVDLFGR